MMWSVLRTLRARLAREEGASLALTMVFIAGSGLVLAALLTYVRTGILSARDTQSRQLLASDASGAMDVAIDALRNSSYEDPNGTCPANGIIVPGAGGKDIRISCRGKAGTGTDVATVPITPLNAPAAAVLTLGTSTLESGIANLADGLLRIKGPIFSNSDIVVHYVAGAPTPASRIEGIQAAVTARTGCKPPNQVFTNVAINCTIGGTPAAEGKDPALLTDADTASGGAIAAGYAQPSTSPDQLVRQIVPAACPAAAVLDLLPGYYDDAVALTNLTSMAGACNKTLHFLPGTYYLDFRNEEGAVVAGAQQIPAGPNVWTISNPNVTVLGGNARGWVGGVPTTFPGSCESPLASTAAGAGVQFIFGGSSRMDVSAGVVELCGQYSATKPALVVYGATSGPAATTWTTTPSLPTLAGKVTGTDTAFVTTAPAGAELTRLWKVDGTFATAPITRAASNTTTTGSVRLTTDLAAAARVPAGSILTKAELRVTHKESSVRSGNADSLAVSVLPNPGRAGPPPSSSAGTAAINDQTGAATPLFKTDTSPDLTSALAQEIWKYGLAGVRIDYSVLAAKAVGGNTTLTADLDSAQLYLEWTPPVVRAQNIAVNGSNCVAALPPATTCALIKTSGSARVYLQGTTYAPLAKFDVNLANAAGAMFKSGLIARSLSVSAVPGSAVGGVVATPAATAGGVSLGAYLVAYACTGTPAQCATAPPATGWLRVGRSEVSLYTAGYTTPSNGGRKVGVLSWHVLE